MIVIKPITVNSDSCKLLNFSTVTEISKMYRLRKPKIMIFFCIPHKVIKLVADDHILLLTWWYEEAKLSSYKTVIRCPNTLEWRHNGRYSVSNHQPHDCLLNRLSRRRSKKRIKAPRHWHLCGNSPGTSEFSTQRASNTEMFSFDDVIMIQCKQQPPASAKTNLYPLPIVLTISSTLEPSYWVMVS